MDHIQLISFSTQNTIDFSAKLFQDLSATSNITRLFSYCIQLLNLHLQDPVLKPLLKNLRVITEISIAKSWIRNIHEILTGTFMGKKPLKLPNGIEIPNILKGCTHISLLGYELSFTLRWLEQQEVLNLASIAAGCTSTLLLYVSTVCGTIACFSDIGDVLYRMRHETPNLEHYMNIALDVSRLVTIALYQFTATYTIALLALISNITYSSIMLGKFVQKYSESNASSS